jgi:hypothetical protein
MGVLSVFMIILTTIFTASIDVQSQSNSYAAATSDGRYALARMEYDIRRASAISTPASAGDNTPNLVLIIGGQPYTYALDNGRLQLTVGAASDYLTSAGAIISGLNFQKLVNGGVPSVHYTFTVTDIDSNSPHSLTYHSTTGLRL